MNKSELGQAAEKVMAFLDDNHYGKSVISDNRTCIARLTEYCKENGCGYSPGIAESWYLSVYKTLGRQQKAAFRITLIRIRDCAETGHVRAEHTFKVTGVLSGTLNGELEEYISCLRGKLKEPAVMGYRSSCREFLLFIQEKGAASIRDVSYDMAVSFHDANDANVYYHKTHNNGRIAGLLTYFHSKGMLPYGFTLLFHYLSRGKGAFWNDVGPQVAGRMAGLERDGNSAPLEKLLEYRDEIVRIHKEYGYSKSVCMTFNKGIELLYLFLDRYHFSYRPAAAMLWFCSVKGHMGKESASIRRALLLAGQLHDGTGICLETFFREKPSAFRNLPEWCREAAYSYEALKIKEGWKRSTLDMIRSCISRFCNYLDSIGIRSYGRIQAPHVRKFNAEDRHRTMAGKNAYNARIRHYLVYLGEKGYLGNPMLFASLPCKSAPKESIVVVLTETEMERLQQALHDGDNGISLRKKAMLLLGLKMGMRGSDIVRLRYDGINWDTASIRFTQKKTDIEVNLPMPAEVGNALFRYITEERKQKPGPDIFLGEKAPFRPVSRAVCREALDSALPDRNVPGSGFHVMRKTYATGLLRNGVGADTVAEVLGQRGTASVHRYLSLDEDRMRMCPLSLAENRIGGWDE